MVSNQTPSEGLNGAVARTLNGHRASGKVSFDELSKRTGMSKRQLLRLLSTMEMELKLPVIETIAKALNLTVIDVLMDADRRLERGQDEPDQTSARSVPKTG